MTELDELDAWLEARIGELNKRAGRHVMAGKSLEQPKYRTLLGEHRAYSHVRSWISGAKKGAK